MPRSSSAHLKDILVACGNIKEYTAGLDLDGFEHDKMVQDATVRNLEIIGEAVKNVPEDVRSRAKDIEWKKIAGLRAGSRVFRYRYRDSMGHYQEQTVGSRRER